MKLFHAASHCGKMEQEVQMKSFELAIAHLRSLPPPAQVQAVDFIERLRVASLEERRESLRRSAGTMSKEEADAFEQAIHESCERVDE